MRKDVKFGLTIGAILVVTLVIYVIVLSRGPSTAQRIGIATPSQSDQASQSTVANSDDSSSSADSSLATHTDDAKPDDQADLSTNTSADNTTAPPAQNNAPATQPTATAQPNSDWDGALNHGLPASLAAPERTVTPTIDPTSSNIALGGISRSPSTPMIDPIPSTQPSRPLMADVPTLEAPATVSPPPTEQYPTPSSTSATNLPSSTPRTHRVASGESPYSISQAVYGSGKYYKKILAANPGIDPRHLKIGKILVIPELTESDRPASSAAANVASSEAIDTSTAYKVVSGDSLESISLKLYGTPQMMDKLYEMNKTLIGPDENMLKIGWILKLPQSPAAADAQR
jgi:nucleoid-associated protein YgaU